MSLSTNSMTLITSLTFIELWVVSVEHLQRVWHAIGKILPFRTPGSVNPLFGTCLCSNCWDQISRTCRVLNYPTFHLEYPSVLSQFCLWPPDDSMYCTWSFYSLYRATYETYSFIPLESCLQPYNAMGTGLVRTASDETSPWYSSFVIVGRDCWTWNKFAYSIIRCCQCFFYILFLLP